MKITDT